MVSLSTNIRVFQIMFFFWGIKFWGLVVGKWESQGAPTEQKENGVAHCHYVFAAHLKWSQCAYMIEAPIVTGKWWEPWRSSFRGTCSGENLWVWVELWAIGVISTYPTLISVLGGWRPLLWFLVLWYSYSTICWKCPLLTDSVLLCWCLCRLLLRVAQPSPRGQERGR